MTFALTKLLQRHESEAEMSADPREIIRDIVAKQCKPLEEAIERLIAAGVQVKRERDALLRETDALAKDAERYRYVRDAGRRDYLVLMEAKDSTYLKFGEHLDAAIRDAIEKEKS